MTPEYGWNMADVWELATAVGPDRVAQAQGPRRTTWHEFDGRASGLSASFLDSGLGHQSKVAVYLYSCPEFMESYYAAMKGSFVPLNINYRYGPEEVRYILDDSDAEAVVFHATFAPVLDEIRPKLSKIRRWYVVDDGAEAPDWATRYEDAVTASSARPHVPWKRSGEDLVLLYTGGTTGMPKGVMW
ncbi:MAG: AMP-binding protein, partial [Nitrososphaerales archaeon]